MGGELPLPLFFCGRMACQSLPIRPPMLVLGSWFRFLFPFRALIAPLPFHPHPALFRVLPGLVECQPLCRRAGARPGL